ncbi:antibiotic biosynthesis monooxygenase family protein [Natronospira bacteriovora]|uniref:ABM domain-containing protein n=1 Tax=Natronospira bacteriovora TaxID=3069753 RepID=A0ABU0W7Q5_9GAMM|nr:antibiotic biosynthesis monooxygenase [Natronospira sp. AB-CW4]MDQ2070068.1 hypothetical protein [Natronospira sp. AB-CW4]
MSECRFVIFYRWELKAKREEDFREAWEVLTRLYSQLYGCAGGRLHRSDDGTWLAYTEWPDRDRYLLAVERGIPDESVAKAMNAAVERRLDPVFMELRSDLL